MPLPHKGLDYTLQFSQESLQVISQIWEPLRLTVGCRIRPPLSLARWPLWTSLMAALSHPRETHPNGRIWFATWVHSKEGKVWSKKVTPFDWTFPPMCSETTALAMCMAGASAPRASLSGQLLSTLGAIRGLEHQNTSTSACATPSPIQSILGQCQSNLVGPI